MFLYGRALLIRAAVHTAAFTFITCQLAARTSHRCNAETIAPNGGKAEVARIGEDSKSTVAVNARTHRDLSGMWLERYGARAARTQPLLFRA